MTCSRRTLSSLEEDRARSGPVVAVAHADLDGKLADDVISRADERAELDPILLTMPLQLLAYHAALALGRDIDQPRNLAKSVTVECSGILPQTEFMREPPDRPELPARLESALEAFRRHLAAERGVSGTRSGPTWATRARAPSWSTPPRLA